MDESLTRNRDDAAPISPGRAGRLAFVLAPALITASALWHPADDTGTIAYGAVSAAPGRWYAVHVAGALGAALAVVIGVSLVRWARSRSDTLVAVAGWLVVIGAFGFFAEQVGHGSLMSALVSADVGSAAASPTWDAFLNMPESVLVGMLSGVFIIGFVVLAVAMIRRADLPTWGGISLLAFVGLSMAAQTSGAPWLLFGAMWGVPLFLVGRQVAAGQVAAAAS